MGRVETTNGDETNAPPKTGSVRARPGVSEGEVGGVVIVAVKGSYLWWFGDEQGLKKTAERKKREGSGREGEVGDDDDRRWSPAVTGGCGGRPESVVVVQGTCPTL